MKKKALISSLLTIALCFSLIAGSTFALFTSESKVNVAVTSGKVDVVAVLKEDSLKAYSGQWNDTLEAYESIEVSADNAKIKTFTNGGTVSANDDSNVLTINKITPMDKVAFVIAITNNSDVTIQYQTVISALNTVTAENGTALLDGLSIKIDGVDTVKVGNNAVTEWSSEFKEGETKEINVEIELPESAGNNYQNLAAEISYAVNAVQANAHVENPSLDSGDTYIYTVADFKEFAASVNAGNSYKGKTVKLMANINLNNEPWAPIGNSTNKFQGTFDGGNFTVYNLKVGEAGQSNVGLFGYTTDGTVKNLNIHNANVVGRLNVGVVAGTPYTTAYENIKITGKVTVEGMSYVGGVLGKNAYANVTNVTVNVSEDSYVKAISTENGTAYRTYVGGVIGFNGEGGHTFKDIASNINVIGDVCDIGGVFGIAHYGNKFENITCTGNVTGTFFDPEYPNDADEIGGIAGVWHNASNYSVSFTNCKFTGKLNAADKSVNVSDNAIVGRPYSSSGNGTLIIDGIEHVATLSALQAKIDAATGEVIIGLADDIAGNLTVKQKEDVKITINGNGKNFAGVITIDGQSKTYLTAALTIKNLNFVAETISADACIRLGDGTNATRYTCNVNVEGCTFDVPEAVGIKSYTGGDKNLTVIGCTATARAHSLMQAKGIDGILIEECDINSIRGANFNNSTNVTVKNSDFDVKKYAVRFGESSGGTGAAETYLITNCTLKSNCEEDDAVIVLRGTADYSTLTIENTTITGTKEIENTAIGATVLR